MKKYRKKSCSDEEEEMIDEKIIENAFEAAFLIGAWDTTQKLSTYCSFYQSFRIGYLSAINALLKNQNEKND